MVEVDIGIRSIFRRLLQGVAAAALDPPPAAAHPAQFHPLGILQRGGARSAAPAAARTSPIEKLEGLHPADLADIVEELGPAEREAIFETIDSEVAADALSEIDPKMQASILESLEPEKAADIVEEMAPDEAADVLSELRRGNPRRDPGRDGRPSPRPRSRNCWNSRRTRPAA